MKHWMEVCLMIFGMSVAALAGDNPWRFDKAHSSVNFNIAHMVISEVHGGFSDFDLAFESSNDDFSDARVDVVIKVSSIYTGNADRDNDLKSEQFFDAQQFPEIRFRSREFRNVAGSRFNIKGDLTLRGITREVTFDAEHRGTLKTPRGTIAAWKATLVINRFDYGLKWNRAIEAVGLVAGETVNITVNIELKK